MSAQRTVERVVGVGLLVSAVASTMAAATIALLLMDPVALTSAIDSRNIAPLASRIAGLIARAFATLLDYL